MLNRAHSRSLFWIAYLLLSFMQCLAAYHNQLFVDEAFYWLEGNWLAWSYAEVPGWTPWTLALSEWLLPRHEFFLRLPGLLAAMAVPWLGMAIHQKVWPTEPDRVWYTGLLLLALPVLGVVGILAIPDIWIVLFTLLAVLALVNATQSGQPLGFVCLGLVLALGINTHMRFWLIVLMAGLIVTWQYRRDKHVLKQLLGITLPLTLIGLVPVLLFNLQHDFPLLHFQLKDRHPWAFQANHFTFYAAQILLTTPWVFYLCLTSIKDSTSSANHQLIKCIRYLAIGHWLVYALLGFYSDTLRINVHWTLISYVLLLIVYNHHNKRLNLWAGITGIGANVGLLLLLLYWLHGQSPPSQLNTQISNNASGWQQLTRKTDELTEHHQLKQLVVDNFMTLAQLRFYTTKAAAPKSLSHPLNDKHGRTQQLALMDLLQPQSSDPGLLVVEHSALKLTQQIPFYQAACQQLHGMQLIDSLNHAQGMKSVLFFKTGGGKCELPPIFYTEQQGSAMNGWVLTRSDQPLEIKLAGNHHQQVDHLPTSTLGENPMFQGLSQQQYQLHHFVVNNIGQRPFQLQFSNAGVTVFSQRLYP